jgi:hypothetical protein
VWLWSGVWERYRQKQRLGKDGDGPGEDAQVLRRD